MKNCIYKLAFCLVACLIFSGSNYAQLSAVVTTMATTCGKPNGTATVTASGGTNYTYQWSAGGSITNTASGLASGNYTVTVYSIPVSDSLVKNFTIGISTAVTASLLSVTQPKCGKSNGTIICATSDSHALNTFLWNGRIIESGAGTDLVNADTGTYTFIVVDSTTGCSDTLPPIVLTDTSSYAVFTNVQVTADSCFGNNKGAINITLGNCASGCTYRWSYSAANTTTSATGLPAGNDTFFVSKGGCTNMDTVVKVPGPLTKLTDTLNVHPDHCGHHVGTAIVLTGGGTAPYTYNWSAGNAMGDSVSQLIGDSAINVTVTDSYGCADTLKGIVGSTKGPSAYLISSDSICGSDNNGVLIANAISGVSPFHYVWSNAQTTNVDAGLAPGNYTVTVYDAVGCDTVLNGVVPQYVAQNSFSITPSGTVNPGQTVEIQILTNVPVSSVNWNPYIVGSTNSTLVSFAPTQNTTYVVTVTYGHTCQFVDSIQVAVVLDTTSKFTIPNTFTPNGDGINDYFKLLTIPSVSSFHIWIFDRWGNKVFESTDANFAWDGRDQFAGGEALGTGVYAYALQYETYDSHEKRTVGGNISLVK